MNTSLDSAAQFTEKPSSGGGVLPPPPEDWDGDRGEPDPYEAWAMLLKMLSCELDGTPGFQEVTSGRVLEEKRGRLGIVVITHDRSNEEQARIEDRVHEFLREQYLQNIPVRFWNRDTIGEAVRFEQATEHISSDLQVLDQDPVFKDRILVAKVRNHPTAGFFLVVADTLTEPDREELTARLSERITSPFRLVNKSVYDSVKKSA